MNAATLRWPGIVRLGLVQTALGAVVVLTTSTLNRIMVVELQLAAMLPGLLVALHYGVQVTRPRWGHGSDVGGRRTPWIIGGMAVLALGGVLAALATVLMSANLVGGIALAALAFAMIGLGVGAAGTSLLVLLAKRTAPERRAAAATIVWIMMLAGFIVTAGMAGHFLDPFSPQRLLAVAAAVSGIAFLVALLAVWGVEGAASAGPLSRWRTFIVRHKGSQLESDRVRGNEVFLERPTPLTPTPWERERPEHVATAEFGSQRHDMEFRKPPLEEASLPNPNPKPSFRKAMAEVWAEAEARNFTVFIFVSMLAYSAQDLILEPFAGAIFGFTPGASTQLAGVQHGGVLIGMVLIGFVATVIGGRWLGSLRGWTVVGCFASALALASLALAGQAAPDWPLRASVFLLGLANGAFAVAAIGSMMALAGKGRGGREGVRMGLWGAAQAIAFGLGGFLGAASVDLVRALTGDALTAYSSVFAVEAALFVAAAWFALRVGQTEGARDLDATPDIIDIGENMLPAGAGKQS